MSSATFIAAGLLLAVAALILLARRRSASPARAGLFAREDQELAREQLTRLLADLQAVSRDLVQRADEKIGGLQQALTQADARIRTLENLLNHEPSRAAAPAKPANPLHDRVYALADSGKPPTEICRETGLEKGEVDLLLGLRKIPARR